MATSSLVAAVALLTLVFTALGRSRASAPQHLRFAPESTIVLEHVCRATRAMLRSGGIPLSVTLDLSSLPMLGASTLGPLEYACTQWRKAGTHVTLTGCGPEVASALWSRSVSARIEVRAPTAAPTMLH
jgi:anti-anti-sigma regulatory factor